MVLYKLFQTLYKIRSIIVFFLLISVKIHAQELSLIKKQTISNPTLISIDKKNQLFLANTAGDIIAYDANLNELNIRFSPQKMADISFLEANATVRVLVFYQELQNFLILDRFLNPTGEYTFENPDIFFVKIATIAYDNNIWLIDEGDFSLKKYEVNLEQVLVNTDLDLLLDMENFDVNFMKEYQNQLFINDKNSGILVFDNLGNYRFTIDIKGLEFFSFYKKSLLYIQQGKLYFYDLYEQKIIKEITLDENIKYVFAFDKKLVLSSDTELKLYELE